MNESLLRQKSYGTLAKFQKYYTFMTLKQVMYLFTKVLIVTWKPEKLEFEHFLMKS